MKVNNEVWGFLEQGRERETASEVTWSASMAPSNADWSIYEGWKFKGWPVMTILRGEVIAEDLKVVGKLGYGKYIPRKKVS